MPFSLSLPYRWRVLATSICLALALTPPSAFADGGSTQEAVQAIIEDKTVGQPDLEIKLASESKYIGYNLLSKTGANQIVSTNCPVLSTQIFHLQLHNRSQQTGDFAIVGEPTPPAWKVEYFDALEDGNDVTAQVTSAGWLLTDIPAGESREFRVEITAGYPAPTDHPFLITAFASGGARDAVQAQVLHQWVQRLEYNTDGTNNFLPIPDTGIITVLKGTTYTLRAIPGCERDPKGDRDWPIVAAQLKPIWTNSSQKLPGYGSQMTYQQNQLTTNPNSYTQIQVECGNTQGVQIQVLPIPVQPREIDIWQDVTAPSSPKGAKRRIVGVLVTDGSGNPLRDVQVTLKGTNLTVLKSATAETDEGGYATFIVESTGPNTGSVTATLEQNPEPVEGQCQIKFE